MKKSDRFILPRERMGGRPHPVGPGFGDYLKRQAAHLTTGESRRTQGLRFPLARVILAVLTLVLLCWLGYQSFLAIRVLD